MLKWIFGTNDRLTEQINDFGVQLLFVFFVILIILLISPKIQNLNFFKHLKDSLKGPIIFIGLCVQITGAFMAYYFFNSTDEFLFSLIGTILVIGGGITIFWARETEKDKYELYSKIILTCASFTIAILWLFYYGREMLNL